MFIAREEERVPYTCLPYTYSSTMAETLWPASEATTAPGAADGVVSMKDAPKGAGSALPAVQDVGGNAAPTGKSGPRFEREEFEDPSRKRCVFLMARD